MVLMLTGRGERSPSVWETARRSLGNSRKIHLKELRVTELKYPPDKPQTATWDLPCCAQSSPGGGCAGDAKEQAGRRAAWSIPAPGAAAPALCSSEPVLGKVIAESSLGPRGKCLHWHGLVNSELFLSLCLIHQAECCLSCFYFSFWYF